MTDEKIERLRRRQDEIDRDYGLSGGAVLAWSSADAAAVSTFSGDPERVDRLSQAYRDAAQALFDAQEALADLRELNADGVWIGTAHNAASDALTALYDDITRAYLNHREVADRLRVYGERLTPALRGDETGRAELCQAAADVGKLAAGPIPDPFSFDAAVLRAAHHLAMAGIEARVAAHTETWANGRDFAAAMHDIADQARARELTGSPLTPLDDVILAAAGGTGPAILTPAMAKRAGDAFRALDRWDRERMTALLAAATSAELRAYLMKALAAGYSVRDVSRFDAMIAAHGTDSAWLDQHLSPLAMDGSPASGRTENSFAGADWAQGEHPTCVASSTVTARAEVDPLYALWLTSGGRPDDPAFDNPRAFAGRLEDEQNRVYDGDRHWYENWWQAGMTDTQSDRIAENEIMPHTGVSYDNVDMDGPESRESVLRAAERAVDDGYPVPVTTEEGGGRHQMMIIGHSDDRVQIYNPWGYTYWVSERDFVAGEVDGIDPDVPRTPVSARLPQAAPAERRGV